MPAPVKITLSSEDKKILTNYVKRRSTSKRLCEHSQIILLAADGLPNYRICEQLNVNHITVAKWRNRFAELGISCLEKELPRGANHGGKDSMDQQKLREKVIRTTIKNKPKGATHWSTRSLAKYLGINHSFVNRVWNDVGLKPHLHTTFKPESVNSFSESFVNDSLNEFTDSGTNQLRAPLKMHFFPDLSVSSVLKSSFTPCNTRRAL